MAANSCNDIMTSKIFKDAFASIGIKNYEKADLSIVKRLVTNKKYLADARLNAQWVNEQTRQAAHVDDAKIPYRLNPYTDMYRLLDAIDEIAAS